MDRLRRVATGVLACSRFVVGLVRATALWAIMVLSLIIVEGLVTDLVTSAPVGLGLLIGPNVLCILVGRSYRPGD